MAQNPWDQDAAPIGSPTGATAGAKAPDVSPDDTSVPWHKDTPAINAPTGSGDPSALRAYASNTGAKFDAIAAALLADEGSDESRYAMTRAKRTQQQAQVDSQGLSKWQQRGVMAADIGTGIALNTLPVVGQVASGAYFGASGMGQELMNEMQETGKYDLNKAGKIAAAQTIAGPIVGGATGKVLGYVAPKVASAIGTAAEKTLPLAGRVIGGTAEAVAKPIGNLVGGDVGATIGNVAGKGLGNTARATGSYVGNTVVPTLANATSKVLTSRGGQAVLGGGTTGSAMQMVSNIGNGKPLMENTGEAFESGMLAGGAVHAGTPVVNTIARRIPTTIGMLRDNITGNRFQPTSEPIPEAPQAAPRATTAEEAAIPTGEPAQPSGAIPADEVGSIPGSQNFDPNAYGNGGQGGMGDFVQPGQGIAGGGIDVDRLYNQASDVVSGLGQGIQRTGESIAEAAGKAAGQAAGHIANNAPRATTSVGTTLWNAFKADGLAGLVDPKSVTQIGRQAATTEKLGLGSGHELVENGRNQELSANAMQNVLAESDPSAPDYQTKVNASVNFAMDHGEAAAHLRANQLAVDTEMPTTARFHDIEVEGKNVAEYHHGIPRAEIIQEHNAIANSKGLDLPFMEGMKAEQIQKFQTHESHYNATRESLNKAESKKNNMVKVNRRIVNDMLSQVREQESPELYSQVKKLDRSMKEYEALLKDVDQGRRVNNDDLRSVASDITALSSALPGDLMNQFININGEKGMFNPALDAKAWDNFHLRSRQMHHNAHSGGYKEEFKNDTLGLGNIQPGNTATWVRPAGRVIFQGVNRVRSAATMAKGHAMLQATQEAAGPKAPTPGERAVEENLSAGNTSGATAASESALNESGIATGNVDLAATPAEEVHPAAQPASLEQHVELARRKHPRAGAKDLTAGEADMYLNFDNMRNAQGIQEPPAPNPEDVAAMAAGRPQEQPAPAPEPEPQPVAEPAPEAPQELAAPFKGQKAPSRLPEQETAPEPVQEPTQGQNFSEGNAKPRNPKFADQTDEQVEQIASDASDVIKNREATPEERIEARQTFREAIDEQEARRAEFEGIKRPKAPAQEQTAQEAVQEPTEAPKEVNQKAPRKLAEPESEPAKPAEEETTTTPEEQPAAPKQEAVKEPEEVADEYSVNDEIPTSHTEFKQGESEGQRNERVASMARSLVKKAIAEIKAKPKKNQTIADMREAEGMAKGIETAIEQANKLADEAGESRADAYTAIMNQEGGIKSLFKGDKGYNEDSINGAVRSAIKIFKQKQKALAEQEVQTSDQIIRKRMGAAKIGRTREERLSRVRADLLSKKGITEDIINQAIDRANNVTERYTAEQVIGHARQILRERAEAAKVKPTVIPAEEHPIVKSRKTLQGYIDKLGASGKTYRDIKKIVDSATEVGGGAAGSRPSLTPEEIDSTIKKIHEALTEAAKTASQAKAASDSKVPAVQNKLKETATNTAKAKAKAVAGEAELRATLKAHEDKFAKLEEQVAKEKEAREAAEKSNAAIQQELADTQKEMQQRIEEARADAREDLHEEYENAPTASIKEFGNIVGEDFPSDITSVNDPEFQAWKDQVDVAAQILEGRKEVHQAKFLKSLSALLDKGLKNLEEMPDRTDLTIGQREFNNVRKAYQDMKHGGSTNVSAATHSQWGVMGQQIRSLLLGGRKEFTHDYSDSQLRAARAKHRLQQAKDVGDGGIDMGEIKVQSKKAEPVAEQNSSQSTATGKEEGALAPTSKPEAKPRKEYSYEADARNKKIIDAARKAFNPNSPDALYRTAREISKDWTDEQLTTTIKAVGKAKSAISRNKYSNPGEGNYLTYLGGELDRIRKELRKKNK